MPSTMTIDSAWISITTINLPTNAGVVKSATPVPLCIYLVPYKVSTKVTNMVRAIVPYLVFTMYLTMAEKMFVVPNILCGPKQSD